MGNRIYVKTDDLKDLEELVKEVILDPNASELHVLLARGTARVLKIDTSKYQYR